MSEIIFVVEEVPEGGLAARAVGESIFTQAPTMAELHERVREAVRCHFDAAALPKLIRLKTGTETSDGIELTPYRTDFAAQMDASEPIMRENRDVLKKLAE